MRLFDYIIQGKILRSKSNWYENGKKTSKFFLNLENNKSRKTAIRRLLNDQGKLILNSQSILKELENFYKSLYTETDSTSTDNILVSSFLHEIEHIPVLTEELKLLCEGSLSNGECFSSLKDFPGGKSPGNDGLTSEFCKKFWPLLGQLLTDSLNYSFTYSELSNSQKQAVIRLIEKKN